MTTSTTRRRAAGHPLAASLLRSTRMSKQSLRASARSAIANFMTPDPQCIGKGETLAAAHQRMRAAKIRHLPVLDGSRLVGVLSQRDLFFAERSNVSPESTLVEQAMTPHVYTVSPQKALGEVAAKMVEEKYGCAVVVRGEHVVGIFTTNDALRVISSILEAWL